MPDELRRRLTRLDEVEDVNHDEHDETRRHGRTPPSAPPSTPAEEEAFVQSVLARTSGRACDRAEGQLGDYLDGTLDHDDAGLVAEHLEHCAPCRAVARMIAEMRAPLRRMATIDPGPGFTAAVIGATTGARAPSRERARALAPLGARPRALALAPAALWMRWCEIWQTLVARPRFALEAAYVGTLLLMLLVGLPRSPLRGLPARAIELAELNPVRAVSGLVSGLGGAGVGDDASPLGQVATWPRRQASELGARWHDVRVAAERLETHGGQVVEGLRQGSTPQVGHGLRAIADDLSLLWNGARGVRPVGPPGSTPPDTSTADTDDVDTGNADMDNADPGNADMGNAVTGSDLDDGSPATTDQERDQEQGVGPHDAAAPGRETGTEHEDETSGSRSAAPPATRENKESRP
jgi:hypothetical protein